MDVSRPTRSPRQAATAWAAQTTNVSPTGVRAAIAPALSESAAPPEPDSLQQAIARTRRWLLGQQSAAGYWEGELEGDTILESEYILLLAFLGLLGSREAQLAANYLVKQQMPTGGWAMYPGGPLEISGSVKAYFALKLTGHSPSAEYMQRARAAILAHGGADAVNSFTRFYLALLGQIGYEHCPAVPPEAVLLPKWLPVNLYRVSSWSRTIIVPLSIMSALKPVARIAPELGIRELFLKHPDQWPVLRCPGLGGGTGVLSWDRFFRTTDRVVKWLERHGWLPRQRALRAAEQWMLDRFKGSDGLGAIFPPIVWSLVALRALGYPDDAPEVRYCHEQLAGLFLKDEDSLRLQPCRSPVWDTAITLRALADSDYSAEQPAAARAVRWLLDKQITGPGDWSETVDVEPGAWCFEHANDFYPDSDDTSMVVMALAEQLGLGSTLPSSGRHAEQTIPRATQASAAIDSALVADTLTAIDRAQRWLLAMQNSDGGWGAFDRDNDHEFLCYVPFADHNAMIDPSTPDLAARVLEALGTLGCRVGTPAVDRAVAYLRNTQEADGSWYGRWGVNYIYGTWQVLTGLRAVGIAEEDPAIVAGAAWLVAHQQPSGGWGETADSYAEPYLRGQGKATASQTAWAVLGLIAAGRADHEAVAAGVRYLMTQQQDDGTWDEPEFTGTGFPKVFYLKYHFYRIYFPLMALARWSRATTGKVASGAEQEVGVTSPDQKQSSVG